MKKSIICFLALVLFSLSGTVLATNGQDTVQKGMAFDYEFQEGPYLRQLRGVVKDPQGLWQALLPLQPPPGARGSYGLIGDDSLLGQGPDLGCGNWAKLRAGT